MNIKNTLQRWFIDPCKKCLVQACCVRECELLTEYKELHEDFYIIIGFIIVLIMLIAVWFALYLSGFILISSILFGVFWIGCGIGLYIYFSSDDSDDSDDSVNHKLYPLIIIIFPYLFLGLLVGSFLNRN